jgi:hypothetical protein
VRSLFTNRTVLILVTFPVVTSNQVFSYFLCHMRETRSAYNIYQRSRKQTKYPVAVGKNEGKIFFLFCVFSLNHSPVGIRDELITGNSQEMVEAEQQCDEWFDHGMHAMGFFQIFRSSFDDWRPHLGLLLQSVPFPDEALTHDRFIE